MYVGDSPTAPGIILPHALDKVDFLWHLGSRRTGDISQPEWRSGKVQQTLLHSTSLHQRLNGGGVEMLCPNKEYSGIQYSNNR